MAEVRKQEHENIADLPKGFKMTELGPLPEEWEVVQLGDIFEEIDRRVKDENEPDIPLLSITRYNGLVLQSQKFEKRVAGKDIRNYKVVRRGEMVYGFPMDEGVIHFLWNFDKGAVSPVYFTWRKKKDDADSHFLDYALRTPQMIEIYQLYTSRTVHRRRIVHPRDFKRINVPLPPLPEQRAIAYVLRTVQRAKEATERDIQATRELKKSLMRHLFTYGPVPIDEAERVPLKETEIGLVPEHWGVVRVGEVGEVITGRTPSTERQEYWNNGSIPFITPPDLDGRAIRYAKRTITKDGLKEARPLPRGTVLVSCIGYIGKVGVTDTDLSVTNQQINAIIPNNMENWFLAYALIHEAALLENRARMTTVPILNKTNFEKIPIPLPPLPEQQEISRILRVVDKKIEAEEARKQALEALFKTLLHNLMTGKIRVKDPTILNTWEVK